MPRTSNLMIMSKRKRSYYEKSPLAKLWGKFSSVDEITEERMPDTKTLDYLESSYPSNHNYVLKQGKLLALGKLSKRYKSISIHYPEGMQSLLTPVVLRVISTLMRSSLMAAKDHWALMFWKPN